MSSLHILRPHHKYQCRTCGRRLAHPRRALQSLISALLPTLIMAWALSSSSARGDDPAVANAVNGAADAFARYATSQESSSPWQVETVEIDASLPRLAKHGYLRAIRRVLPFGPPQYQVLETTGDQVVKREVIARYLSEDIHASELSSASVAITPENYSFHYNGYKLTAGGLAYIFSIAPRKKREGLIKGELWLDAATGSAVRLSGYLVRTSSIFVRRVDVAREVRLRDGVAEARVSHLTIDTRLAGKAVLTIVERPIPTSTSGEF